ncbi:MAG: T9SS type A sorting domain-containing protein, partial [Hymenobacteraceae bacterium]|nr:T9SS type A sorting domain-containing protein [Hymenobacteraceae bacterium]
NYAFNPTISGGWDLDLIYSRLKAEGVEVLVCLKTLPKWMLATYPEGERDSENVPVKYGKDFTDPKSYIEQAKLAYQFAARYGSNSKVDASMLNGVVTGVVYPTAQNSPVRTSEAGLGLVQYMECDNERDKWWKGRRAYQTGREYAANLSAYYDGHKNTMGPGVGVKNADPNMKVVMAGLAGPNMDYVRGMIDWCKEFRGYNPDGTVNLCWDIINYHDYSTNNQARGAAPEVSNAGEKAVEFVQLAQQYAYGMPVWISELGFDINQGSPLKAIPIGNKSVLETQADWILRSSLLYARSGVEKVFFYQAYDHNVALDGKYASMGLLNKDTKTPKPAAQYLQQANRLMGEYVFKETINNDPIVDRYEYKGQSAYVLVVPDERGRTAEYTLSLGNATSANVYSPKIGQDSMAVRKVATTNGNLKLTVTETPVFVIASGGTVQPNTPEQTCSAGSILMEQWQNISGGLISAIPLNVAPGTARELTLFEIPTNASNNYGTRVRGYVCPPLTGEYTFFVAGDDQAELWLSTDDKPANKVKIAYTKWRTASRTWTNHTTQKSAKIKLEAGKRYYIEALHKEGWGDDNLSVAWQLPDGKMEGPIPGNRLSPFETLKTSVSTATMAVEGATLQEQTETDELIAYPNPFTDQTTVRFTLTEDSEAEVELYDMSGRLIQHLFKGQVEARVAQEIALSGEGLVRGVYIIRLVTNNQVLTRNVVVAQ